LPKDLAKKYQAIPFGVQGGSLSVAMANPNNIQAIEFIERKSGYRVTPYMTSEDNITRIIGQYKDFNTEVNEAIRELEGQDVVVVKKEKKDDRPQVTLAQDAPVTRAVNTILEYAIKMKASDIHIEPWEGNLKIRYRVDGILQETMTLPSHIEAALVSRIKIMSELKIDEHRVPQDGRFSTNVEGHNIDVRVAISPTVHGEKVVMRLLDKSAGAIDLNSLGVRGGAFRLIEAGTKKPHGMILSTGPTGSGKTTSLYAILSKINKPEINIVTLEDPVEYQVGGVNQIQINATIGLTFASGLRSILRQDPDVIMVGEIRDSETADLAVQSALTGHTVLSTLHTNSAAGVLPRLLDMNIEPFLIASTVTTIIGQRLVRKLCPDCREAYEPSEVTKMAFEKTVGHLLPKSAEEMKQLGYENLPLAGSGKYQIYRAKGCSHCNNTGYAGRFGIFEVFNMSPELEKMVVNHATSNEVQAQAVSEGMITMHQDGFLKALEGSTTIEEVVAKIAVS
jgi:type IV pilus assembly protein PilB